MQTKREARNNRGHQQPVPCRLLAGAALALLSAFTLTACGSTPVRPDHLAEPDKSRLGRVAFVVDRRDPQFEFESRTGGKGEGAAKGAGEGAVASIQCGILFIICLPITATAGAAMGAHASASTDTLQNTKSALQAELATLGVPQKLHIALEKYIQRTGVHAVVLPLDAGLNTAGSTADYNSMAANTDIVVEISANRLEAHTSGEKKVVVALSINAHIRVLNTKDGRVLDDFATPAAPYAATVEEWMERGAEGISEMILAEVSEIAETAVDETLLIYHSKIAFVKRPDIPIKAQPTVLDTPKPQKQLVPGYALRPVNPPFRNRVYFDQKMNMGHLEIFGLPDLQPTFEWEHFPVEFDVTPGNGPGEAKNLLYDFRLFLFNGIIEYERTGLKTSRHQLEEPLRPCTAYRWTVRATFELNGTPRATEWTGGYDTIGGSVGPWEWRRGRRTSILFLLPNTTKYPIVMTPTSNGGACPNV